MTDRRLQLDAELREVLGISASEEDYLYFEPPGSVQMKYDCIVYTRQTMSALYVNNRAYRLQDCYQVMAIYRDPDSDLPNRIQDRFELCSPGKQFMADNLYHFPFTIYY